MEADYFLQRIEDLDSMAARIPREIFREDLLALVLEVLAYVRRTIDVERLNRMLLSISHVDIDALRQISDIFGRLDLDGPFELFPERTLYPSSSLEEYRSFINRLDQDARTLSQLDLSFRLEISSHALDDLLLCAAAAQADLSDVSHIVREKFDLLNDDQVISVWSRIQRELSPDRTYSMVQDLDILPENWLRTTTISDVKSKISDYIVTLKPRLELSMFEAGRYTIPSEAPSLAVVLSLSAEAVATPISQSELDLARALARLRAYWLRLLNRPGTDFSQALGLPDRETFLDNEEHQGAAARLSHTDVSIESLVVYELRKVTRATNAFSTYESPIERALVQYKLGTEVMAPDNIGDMKGKGELKLQKELCRFLLERGVFTVGTKFGRSELDLLAELPDEGYVIEAKVYKEGRRITERTIKSNLVQLQSYLDQSPTRRRGILLIYNFSSTLISAPRHWIGGRFWFLPINLQQTPPSSRNRSLMIEPGDGEEVIRVLTVKAPLKD